MDDRCKSYRFGQKAVITLHCHDQKRTWYEVVVTMPDGTTKRVCSEYWWAESAHAMAAAMGRFVGIDRPPLEDDWDDRIIPGATRRTGTSFWRSE